MTVALTCASATAQERGQVGIAMGYPGTVSVIWHATDTIAIEPKISFLQSSTDSRVESRLTINGVVVTSSEVTTAQDGWSVSPGFDLRFTVGKWDNVSAYVAPGYTYLRGSTTIVTATDSPFATILSETRKYSTRGHDVRGMLGVQYTPHRKFAVFGQFGVRYSRSEQRLGNDITTRLIGNTSAVGAILYF